MDDRKTDVTGRARLAAAFERQLRQIAILADSVADDVDEDELLERLGTSPHTANLTPADLVVALSTMPNGSRLESVVAVAITEKYRTRKNTVPALGRRIVRGRASRRSSRRRGQVRTGHGPPGRPRPADDAEPPLAAAPVGGAA